MIVLSFRDPAKHVRSVLDMSWGLGIAASATARTSGLTDYDPTQVLNGTDPDIPDGRIRRQTLESVTR